jgi:tetratricopeptide (TPR) repeat protein
MLKRLPLFSLIFVLAGWLGWHITRQLVATSLLAYWQDGASRALATSYAPGNPVMHAALGKYLLYRAEAPQWAEGLAAMQRAAALTPNDYRYQLELARAYAANQRNGEAARSFQRAIELAPRHFETHWAYANFALRLGQREVALDAFRQALSLSGQDRAYRAEVEQASAQHAYAAVTGAYGFDLSALERATPPTPKAQMHLVGFLAQRDSLDLALAKWKTLPVADAATYRRLLFKLLNETQQAKRFSDARDVWLRLLALEGEAANDWLTNGGFEQAPLNERYADLQNGFDWQIEGHAEVAADRTELAAHSGKQSLRLRLVARLAEPFHHVTQRVIVEPNAAYRLRFWVKASELPSETPYLEIADATAPQGFRLTAVFPRQTDDWQEQSLRFTIPATTKVIVLRLCVPVMATLDLNRRNSVWLDDVSLVRE